MLIFGHAHFVFDPGAVTTEFPASRQLGGMPLVRASVLSSLERFAACSVSQYQQQAEIDGELCFALARSAAANRTRRIGEMPTVCWSAELWARSVCI